MQYCCEFYVQFLTKLRSKLWLLPYSKIRLPNKDVYQKFEIAFIQIFIWQITHVLEHLRFIK